MKPKILRAGDGGRISRIKKKGLEWRSEKNCQGVGRNGWNDRSGRWKPLANLETKTKKKAEGETLGKEGKKGSGGLPLPFAAIGTSAPKNEMEATKSMSGFREERSPGGGGDILK